MQVVTAFELFACCQRQARCVDSLQQAGWGHSMADDPVQKSSDGILDLEEEEAGLDVLLPCNLQGGSLGVGAPRLLHVAGTGFGTVAGPHPHPRRRLSLRIFPGGCGP